ncbi:hypothetical protein RF11_14514 [Thelohanellus kitauei]|uniref:Uncharacterized protein n=1 Tax=Thelohanellus kitauei TaxID=669202 RepID=A0A0C2NJQ7_THEKT|nr:hypothetical protein RF11_12598 [Thelohanellus kitauei]KII74257.1 hypothetical protein RF11_14514 [Thelohanellus kitauei]
MLLAEMRSLACGHISCIFFEYIFLKKPENVRLQLTYAYFTDLHKYGKRADEIWQARLADANIQSLKPSKTNEQKTRMQNPKPCKTCFFIIKDSRVDHKNADHHGHTTKQGGHLYT